MAQDELMPPYVTRDQSEWEQAPCSIKGGASHPGYWATSDGEHVQWISTCCYFRIAVLSLGRNHDILLSIVKVGGQCLFRGPVG